MNKKKIERHLKSAVDGIKPNLFEDIASANIMKMEQEDFTMKQDAPHPVHTKRKAIISVCVAFLLIISVCAGMFLHANRVESIVAIDVNPSIELTVNDANRVLTATPLNQDAETILAGMDLKKVDLFVAVNAIIGSMVKNGYLVDDITDAILVSVQNSDQQKADALKNEVVSDINSYLTQNNVTATVYNQNVTSNDDLQKLAQQYGISYGKMYFIDQLVKLDGTLTLEQLAPLSIHEICHLVQNRNLSLEGIIEYDYDDSLKENIQDTIEDLNDTDRCQRCTNGCTCDDCDEYTGGCPECKSDCACFGSGTKNGKSGPCGICSSDCICKECYDGDGCDQWCDDCNQSCKNYMSKRTGNQKNPCGKCSSDCTCEECYDQGGCDTGCDDCNKTCKNYYDDDDHKGNGHQQQNRIRNQQCKPCGRCSADCTCEECADNDGCDFPCDDCIRSCRNYGED